MSEYTTDEILRMIEEHGGPQGLDLSRRDLSGIDLSAETIRARREEWRSGGEPPWWDVLFRGVALWHANLQKANLERAVLQRANLLGANLQEVNLESAILQEADLSSANLQEADLFLTDLRGAALGDANLRGASLMQADLEGANLQGANLQGAMLERADLQGANLEGANLEKADLRGADLQRANLIGAHLQGANLLGANLQGAMLERAGLQEAVLEGANLQRANLLGANLQGAMLERAELQGANLWDANFQGARLVGVNLQGAHLEGANLTDVNLVDTESIRGIYLYRARLDRTDLTKDQLSGAIGEERDKRYYEAREAYLALKQNFESLGRYDDAGWAYIKERQMEKAASAPWRARQFYGEAQLGDTWEPVGDGVASELQLQPHLPRWHPRVLWFYVRYTIKWLTDWAVELLCGYGESISRVVGSIIVTLLIFGVAFWVVVERSGAGHPSLADYVIFTLGHLTPADVGEHLPRNNLIDLLATLEAFIGIALTGFLGFVVGNRIRRS